MTHIPYPGIGREKTPFLYRIPILGRMARETLDGDEDTPFYAIVAILSLWLGGFLTIGYPALIIGGLMMTAVMFLVIIRISLG